MSSYPSSPPQGVEQHCYRHADRRAGVTCQRCNRPICPSCMVSASVGFQCPECAKSGAKQQRLVDAFKQTTTPRLTYALIAVNVLIYSIGVSSSASIGGQYGSFEGRFGLYRAAVHYGEWWRIFTSGFLHASVLHLGFNMFALYMIGGFLERIIGPVKFALIYAVSLIGGSLGVILLAGPRDLTVGASGAIFGVFGAFAVLQLSRGMNPMQSGIGSTILLNLVITFAVPGISIGGHLGGLLTGVACAALLIGINPTQARDRMSKLRIYGPAVAVLGVALLGASLAAAQALGVG
ncbi:MAG: rhomboid family intramembrane serine protease [Acidimicrobiales bacterium]